MGTIDIVIYDNWFGFIYNAILAISSKIYYFLKGENYTGAGVIFGMCILLFFMYPTIKMLMTVGSFSKDSGGVIDYTNNIIKTDFFYKAFIAGILLFVLFWEVEIRLLINPNSTSGAIPPEVTEMLLEKGLGFDKQNEYVKKDSEGYLVFKEPLIIGASVYFVDTVFNLLILPLTKVFKISDEYVDNFKQINVDAFGIFTEGMMLASNQSNIYDNLADAVSLLPPLGHPTVFPKHHTKDYYKEDDTLIPKIREIFVTPLKTSWWAKIFGIESTPIDDKSLSPASGALYTILSKFNYLMIYDGGYNSIYDAKSNRNLKELTGDILTFLDQDKNSINPNDFLKSIKTNDRRLLISNNISNQGFNFNEQSNLHNIMLTHPEVAELFAIVLSWYKHTPLVAQELQEKSKMYLTICKEGVLLKEHEKKYCESNKVSGVKEVIDSVKDDKIYVTGNLSVMKDKSLFYWNSTPDNYLKTMHTYFNTGSKSGGESYLDKIKGVKNKGALKEFNQFLGALFTNDAANSVYGLALKQILSENTVQANLFNTGEKEIEFDANYFDNVLKVLKDQQDRLDGDGSSLGIIKLTEKYIETLSLLDNLIMQAQSVGGKPISVTGPSGESLPINIELLSDIDSSGRDYLLQTINYWKKVHNVAIIVRNNIAKMTNYLNSLKQLTDTPNNRDVEASLSDKVISKEQNFINENSDNLFYYFIKIIADMSDIDNKEHVSEPMFGGEAKFGKGLLATSTVQIVKAFVWFLYYILVCITLFLLFYFLLQRLIAFTIYFTLWPVIFFKAAFLGSFKETLIGFFTSWASFRCFDFAFLIGFIFIKFMGYFCTSSAIFATRLFDGYGSEAIKSVNMFITVISMLISVLLIRFIYTRMVQLITNRFDVIADSLGKVADMAMAQSGAVASLGAAGMKMAGRVAGTMLAFIPAVGPLIGGAANMASDKVADVAQKLSEKITNPTDGQK